MCQNPSIEIMFRKPFLQSATITLESLVSWVDVALTSIACIYVYTHCKSIPLNSYSYSYMYIFSYSHYL